jgi:thiol:disulfide interchange protein DsbC
MCASPTQRNLALAQRLRVNGTPAMFFEDGSRLASAVPASVVEQRLAKAAKGN